MSRCLIKNWNLNEDGINLKLKYYSILFILVGLLSACNISIEPKEHLEEIYSVALDAIMGQDEALNRGLAYIAIDMSNFEDVDERGKEEIISYFSEKYKVDVMDATFEQLKEDGLYNSDTMTLDGVLLEINKVDFKLNNEVLFEGSKFSSNLGSVGKEIKVHYKDNKWQSKEVKMIWIS